MTAIANLHKQGNANITIDSIIENLSEQECADIGSKIRQSYIFKAEKS